MSLSVSPRSAVNSGVLQERREVGSGRQRVDATVGAGAGILLHAAYNARRMLPGPARSVGTRSELGVHAIQRMHMGANGRNENALHAPDEKRSPARRRLADRQRTSE